MKYELYFPAYNARLSLDTENPLSLEEEVSFGKTTVLVPKKLINDHRNAINLVGKTFRVIRICRVISEIDNSHISSHKNKVVAVLE